MSDLSSRTHSTPRVSAGFTIIELLVAVAITAAMAAVMLAMTTNIMSSWTRASGNLAAQTQARLALDFLQRDLERALFRQDGNVWFAVDSLTAPGGNRPPNVWQNPSNANRAKPLSMSPGSRESAWDPDQDRFGWAGVWLRFFTADPEVNAVSYQIVRRTPVEMSTALSQQEIDARARYMLYRSWVPSESTFIHGYNILNPDYNPPTGPSEGRGSREEFDYPEYGANTMAQRAEAAEIRYPSRDSVVASNVVDFGVRLFWRTRVNPGNPNSEFTYVEIFPRPQPPIASGLNSNLAHRSPALVGQRPQPQDRTTANYSEYTFALDPTNATQASTRIPHVAEITLRVLTDEGATLLSNYEAGRIEGDWWEIVEAHSKLFTRRVVLRNVPEGR